MRTRKWIAGLTVLAAATAFAGCGSDEDEGGSGSNKVTVTIGLPSANPVFAELWVAKEKGYFESNDVNVKIEFSQGAAVAGTLLSAGKTDMTLSPVDWLPAAVTGGNDLVNIYQQSYSPAFALVYLKDGRYQSISDLAGANVGVVAAGSASALLLQSELVKAGVDPKDVTMTPIGVGATANTALKTKRVDAAVYSIQYVPTLTSDGIEVNVEEFSDLIGNYPGGGFVVQRDDLEGKEAAFQGVLKAYAKAAQLCQDDLDACLDSYIKESSDTIPRAALKTTLEARKPLLTLPSEAGGKWGYSAQSYWETLLGMTPPPADGKKLPEADALFTTDLFSKLND